MIIVATTPANRGHICRPHTEQQRRDQPVQAEGPRESNNRRRCPRGASPSLITSASTLDRFAPSAMRMPISRRRSATMEETTPYVPTAASSSARPAKSPSSCARKRGRWMESAKTRFHIPKANDRHRAVYFTDDALDRLRQCRWCEGRAQHDVLEWRNPQPWSGSRDLLN